MWNGACALGRATFLVAALVLVGCESITQPEDPLAMAPTVPVAHPNGPGVVPVSVDLAQTASADCDWDAAEAGMYGCSLATSSTTGYAACAVVVWQSSCDGISFYDFVEKFATYDGPVGGGGGGTF